MRLKSNIAEPGQDRSAIEAITHVVFSSSVPCSVALRMNTRAFAYSHTSATSETHLITRSHSAV